MSSTSIPYTAVSLQEMTREEAASWLVKMTRVLVDAPRIVVAGMAEDAEIRVLDRKNFPVPVLRQWARMAILEDGYRGHVRLCLYPPYDARAVAMIYGILMSVED